MWRVVPGGLHDIIEGEGENQTVFAVDSIPPPRVGGANGSYVVDLAGALSPLSIKYINGNMSLLDR